MGINDNPKLTYSSTYVIQFRYEGREQAMPSYEVHHLDRLEQQARLLHRTRRNLEQSARSIINRLILCCRPFQVNNKLLRRTHMTYN